MNHPLRRAVLGAVARSVVLLVGVAVTLFLAIEVLPGDAVTRSLGANFTPELAEARRAALGLDRSLVVRGFSWLADAARADFGRSYISGEPVTEELGSPLANSLLLAGLAAVMVLVLSVGLGTLAGRVPGGRADRWVSGLALSIAAIPEFVTAGLLIAVTALWAGWLPAVSLVPAGGTPFDDPVILLIPAITIALVAGAWATRFVRAAVASASQSPHVDAARLAGISERRVLVRYLLPGVIGQIAQVQAIVSGYLIGGAIVVERLVAYPGLGSKLSSAVIDRDEPVVLAGGLALGALVISALLIADLFVIVANPKLRHGRDATQPVGDHGDHRATVDE